MNPHFLLSRNNVNLKTWKQSPMDMAKVVTGLFPNGKSTGENGVKIFWLTTAEVL
jgi:hypothetical protein